jgi:hypothetical protein
MQLVENAFNYSILRDTAFSTLTKVIEKRLCLIGWLSKVLTEHDEKCYRK